MTPSSALVVGTGLVGTSVALALTARGVRVLLTDRDPDAVRVARERGAGRPWDGERVDVVVLAMPPQYVADRLASLQWCDAGDVYTDVASVKVDPIRAAERRGCDLSRYVPGHPIAGGERSGPAAARADLFRGRPWALCPTARTSPDALAKVRALVELCGGRVVITEAAQHDGAMALISHAPHVMATAVAARLVDAPGLAVGLAGQGLRDTTRIAAGDPALWREILSRNAGPVADVLTAIAGDLHEMAEALRGGRPDVVTELLREGVTGRRRITAPSAN
ncbi:MAG TPA: prephenate dehydrogenase [Thermomonospora sp.]|nr:prephenate dehydrogenase [Thermomonospora sp.]